MATLEELKVKYKEVDPFLLKKWVIMFNKFFDRNASHEVDWSDFYVVVRQVRELYGAESAQMTYAKQSLKALWDGLLTIADKDKDEKIQLEEWVQVLKTTSIDKEPKWFAEYQTYMFKLFDVSADNRLDLSEYTDGMIVYGGSTAEAHAAFKSFALDASGKPVASLDYPQFKKLWQEYFYSKDPKAKGNNLFGILKD